MSKNSKLYPVGILSYPCVDGTLNNASDFRTFCQRRLRTRDLPQDLFLIDFITKVISFIYSFPTHPNLRNPLDVWWWKVVLLRTYMSYVVQLYANQVFTAFLPFVRRPSVFKFWRSTGLAVLLLSISFWLSPVQWKSTSFYEVYRVPFICLIKDSIFSLRLFWCWQIILIFSVCFRRRRRWAEKEQCSTHSLRIEQLCQT